MSETGDSSPVYEVKAFSGGQTISSVVENRSPSNTRLPSPPVCIVTERPDGSRTREVDDPDDSG